MFRTKFSLGVLLAIILLATQVFVAGAAPAGQDSTPITGNVDNIEVQTNPDTLETTVFVTITDESGTQTLELSIETAKAFEPPLVILDENDMPVPNEDVLDTDIEIDPSTVINAEPVEESTEEEHPVGSALADFFFDAFGVDYDTVMGYHQDGYGFGVIAQALWMTNALEGDKDTFALIIEAKKTKDFSGLGVTLPDGSEPQNWGQFRKAVMSDRDKAKENLGAIMSGRADKPGNGTQIEEGAVTKSNNGNGIGKSNNGKSGSDGLSVPENGNTGNNGVGNNGNHGNNANNNGKDKSNNGKNKNK